MRLDGVVPLAAALALAALLQACATLPRPPLPPSGACLPLQSFDQGGDGWYYRQLDGTHNSDLWRGGAGFGGTGALVLPPGVDLILRDGPLDLPRANLCFLGRTADRHTGGPQRSGGCARGDTAACAGSGCFLTQFPPRSPCPTGAGPGSPAAALGGFDLYQFPRQRSRAHVVKSREVAFIAVRHDGEFVIDSLGVLFSTTADCLAVCRRSDANCNDGNRCTADTCLAGRLPQRSRLCRRPLDGGDPDGFRPRVASARACPRCNSGPTAARLGACRQSPRPESTPAGGAA